MRVSRREVFLDEMSLSRLLLLILSGAALHSCSGVDYDLYEELGVARDSSKAEIKRAFRKQV